MPAPSVLLVDDNLVIREGLSELLGATDGLTVWGTAASGDDALGQLGTTAASGTGGPSVVVTDLQMPGMDGIALVAEVHARWPALPCVVFSARQCQEYAVRAEAAGAAQCVEKGDPDALIKAILRVGTGAA